MRTVLEENERRRDNERNGRGDREGEETNVFPR